MGRGGVLRLHPGLRRRHGPRLRRPRVTEVSYSHIEPRLDARKFEPRSLAYEQSVRPVYRNRYLDRERHKPNICSGHGDRCEMDTGLDYTSGEQPRGERIADAGSIAEQSHDQQYARDG